MSRQALELAHGGRRYPALAAFLDRDWRVNGTHRNPSDRVLDEAVLHVRNCTAYEDLVTVLDPVRAPQRAIFGAAPASVFRVSFAAD